MIPLAVFGSVLVGLVILFFANRRDLSNPYIVVLRCADHATEQQALSYLEGNVARCVVKSKTAQRNMIELNLEVRLKDDNTDIVNALADINGVDSAVLVSYNGDYMG